jgi:hypothetical protein
MYPAASDKLQILKGLFNLHFNRCLFKMAASKARQGAEDPGVDNETVLRARLP